MRNSSESSALILKAFQRLIRRAYHPTIINHHALTIPKTPSFNMIGTSGVIRLYHRQTSIHPASSIFLACIIHSPWTWMISTGRIIRERLISEVFGADHDQTRLFNMTTSAIQNRTPRRIHGYNSSILEEDVKKKLSENV